MPKVSLQKIATVVVSIVIVATIGLAVTPKPAHAFVLFGIHLFEKAKPTPTPTPIPTATPTPKPSVSPTATVIAPNGNLPTTGPEESVGTVLLAVIGSLIALKLVRTA